MNLAVLALLLAAEAPQLFADANAAYLSGEVGRAVASYEALIAQGITSAELETNLGAAYLRQGKRGLAAVHFERALFLDPGDDDARADLVELHRGNVDKLEGEGDEGGSDALLRALATLPGGGAAALLVLSWCAAWLLLGLRLFRPGLSWAAAAAGVAFALALCAAGVTWAAAAGREMALRRAVVVAQAIQAREGPAERSISHFEVHEGTTVRVEDKEGDYRRVKLSNGLTGWVPSSAVELVVPPGWAGRPVMSGSPRAAQP